MRLLTLLRHAKSDWSDETLADFDRPLKDRGRRDAPLMGHYFAQLDLLPELIVSSSARRARQTADLFAEAAGLRGVVRWEDALYMATGQEILSVVAGLPDDVAHAMVVGHNPGLEEATSLLIGASAAGETLGVRLPTCAAAHLVLLVDSWSEVRPGCGQLQWLVTPKLLPKAGK